MRLCCINYMRHANAWRKRIREYEKVVWQQFHEMEAMRDDLKFTREELAIRVAVINDFRREIKEMRARIKELEERDREEKGGAS